VLPNLINKMYGTSRIILVIADECLDTTFVVDVNWLALVNSPQNVFNVKFILKLLLIIIYLNLTLIGLVNEDWFCIFN
jgi:hypothetical protein